MDKKEQNCKARLGRLEKKVKYLSVLHEVNKAISSELDFEKTVLITVDSIEKKMGFKGGALSLIDDSGKTMHVHAASGSKLAKLVESILTNVKPLQDYTVDLTRSHENLTIKAAKYGKVYIGERLSDFISPQPVPEKLANMIQKSMNIGSLVAIPIIIRGKVKGVLDFILEKGEAEITEDDKEIMITFARQAGIGMENALLYEQIQRQYQDLLVLRKITDVITSTLDLSKVAQEIVNSVTTRLNFVAGLISLIDADTYQLYLTAISETSGMKTARRMIGSLGKQAISIDDKKNLLAVAARDMKTQTTDKLEEILSPPVNIRIAQRIQKMNKIRGVVVLPIMAQGRALGSLAIGLDKSVSEVTDQEKETLITLANEAGLAIDNAQLFERTQRFNIELKDEVGRATKELKDANKKLTNLDKAKSEFISIASHQLRTPLSTIKGYLSMILEGDYGIISDKVGKVLTRVYNSNERLVALVNNMLNVSRIESGRIKFNPQPIQLDLLIDDVLGELAPEAKSQRVDLIFKKPSWKPKPVLADQKLLHEVILNLVDNGIKYTSHGTVMVRLKRHLNGLEVQVKDTGIGMSKEDKGRLFKKFSRGRDAYRHYTGGSGLGLYVVRKLVELNGGQIEGSSKGKGKGSLFKFTIPYA
ncbi:ATP-binding protein [Patescibacteria group bacterium]